MVVTLSTAGLAPSMDVLVGEDPGCSSREAGGLGEAYRLQCPQASRRSWLLAGGVEAHAP
ncbi:hypothetical protein [Mesorhizobium sp. 1B3]|uniref:hypothetical protein n=1 Tax=Mesorhizobium sp. 1B3 TaxID=3243599 RepID=UPI003D9712E2